MADGTVTLDHPFILVHLRAMGQLVIFSHLEISSVGNDNGDEAEAWRLAAELLEHAAEEAMEKYLEKSQ